MKTCTSIEELRDLVVLEQLLNTLPEDARIFVKERKPRTSMEAGRLADDYIAARKDEAAEKGEEEKAPDRRQSLRCGKCRKLGHLARDCRQSQPKLEREKDKGEAARRPKRDLKDIECFNCHQKGHYASNCPSNALFCREKLPGKVGEQTRTGTELTRKGSVEGKAVNNILLDTGCSRTLVHQELVPRSKMLDGEAVAIRCAHGDTVLYPVALLQVVVGTRTMEVRAAVSETLPVDVLLGTDVPELPELLRTDFSADAMAVMTRAQRRQMLTEEEETRQKEQESGASSTGVDEVGEWMSSLDDDLFGGGQTRARQSRAQKRAERHAYAKDMAESDDPVLADVQSEGDSHPLDISAEQLRTLQSTDITLEAVRRAADGQPCSAGVGFFRRDGLLYRLWTPPGRDEEMATEQLVLPMQCRRAVLEVAHDIPLSGHLGKGKTAQRILQRFYWPTLYRDVAEYCRTCELCQKTSRRRPRKVPLSPLPVVEEPFGQIAMDIVGPLPKSRSGKRYVLVICDYATRYPEAVALRSIDAEHIAEELVAVFPRVGVPREILTDQGSNFTSRLLTELYRLLHVHPIGTSPYHPQTDGLVERFNQTLKAMLRKAAQTEGKDWDKLIPFLLFAYREVPQASTGFSPFELLYGRAVRGPLDILRESWEAAKKSDESVVSYILSLREKLEKMSQLARSNLQTAQSTQKEWYDRTARERSFQLGDQVLILLPTTANKLAAEWQGPYRIIKRVGEVDYVVHMHDRRKKNRLFHVNMLRKWQVHEPTDTGYWCEEVLETSDDDLPVWGGIDGSTFTEARLAGRLSQDQRATLRGVLEVFSDVFQDKPGRTSVTEHVIETGSAQPVRLPPYRLPHAYRQAVKDELEEMISSGIIEPATSEWSAPIVLVKKRDGSLRLCVDYRRLNQVSMSDAYPMPRVDDLIDRVGKSTYISTLDLTRGYWQVPVAIKDRPKTAFSTPFGLYQFNTMPFGLKGAPATFQRLMDRVIHGLNFAAAYLDDLIIFSESWEDHLTHIQMVLERLRHAGLTAKARKCEFGASECVYLGHIVGSGTVRPEEDKTAAVRQFPMSETKKAVRSFLGLTGYYRRFVENYSAVAVPLTNLTKKNSPHKVVWTEACEEAFTKLKELLCSVPILMSPDFEKSFVLQTDASEHGVGAVLSQQGDDGHEHPVAYWSRKLLIREQKYSTIEKECLAIKLGVSAFRLYLLGRPFCIETDHRSLVWMERLKHTNNRLARWSLTLQPFQFTIRHRAGSANGNADALSRATT